MKTIFFQSLGCPKNLVDTEVMLGISQKNNFQVVPTPEKAEVIVVNTCSFINESKQESIDTILELAEHKEKNRCERLIVTGCLPQRYKEDIKAAFPEVDAFVGTGQYAQILDYIEGKKESSLGFKHPRYIHSENTPRLNSQPSHRAYLKISEGCIKACGFCIIPKIRGTLRSRSIDSLMTEAKKLVENGALELNLIAQDLSDYGKDFGKQNHLQDLLKELVTIPDLRWIRLLYMYPDELSEEFITWLASQPKICPYIDMPVQHINDEVLKRMNRKRVTGEWIKSRVQKLRDFWPGVSIRSTLLVGYPGETEEQFEELIKFVKEVRFDHLGVFAYSDEENTLSHDLDQRLDEETKQRRRKTILELQQNISQDKLESYIGQTLDVVLEKPSDDLPYLWEARHSRQAPEIDGQTLVRGTEDCFEFKKGQTLQVKIEGALDYDLVASPLDLNS